MSAEHGRCECWVHHRVRAYPQLPKEAYDGMVGLVSAEVQNQVDAHLFSTRAVVGSVIGEEIWDESV